LLEPKKPRQLNKIVVCGVVNHQAVLKRAQSRLRVH
jgi:hypothetical protein